MLKNHPRIRLGLYLLGIAAAVAAPIIGVQAPDYGAAASTASAVLTSAALGTAVANRDTAPKTE